MKILIIGGSGFIGREILRACAGHDVTLFTRWNKAGPYPIICGERKDLPDRRDLFTAAPPDVVIDTGAQNRETASYVINAFHGFCPHFVMLSSISVYRRYGLLLGTEECGEAEAEPLGEDAPLRTRLHVYRQMDGTSVDPARPWLADYDKIPAERAYADIPGARTTILRLPMTYGHGDPDERAQESARRMEKTPMAIWRSVASWRNARGHVANVADAIVHASLQAFETSGVRIFNVADTPDLPEEDWMRAIAATTGRSQTLEVVPDGDPRAKPPVSDFPAAADYRFHLTVSTERIREQLGWTPPMGLEAALNATFAKE